MAACNFKIRFNGSAEQVFQKAKKAVEAQGGNFSGTVESGNFDISIFSNSIAGSYSISGDEMDIAITSKPFLISCSMIESFLQGQLGS